MDAQVRNHLGDSISVELRDGATGVLIGFISNDAAGLAIEGTDSVRRMWHAKIDITCESIAVLPNGPGDIRRLWHRLLDGPYRPAADSISNEGNAWIFDLQKARAE